MKKYVKFISVCLILTNIVILNVNASSGKLKSSSITSCNGVVYGQHSSDNHWHIAKKSESGDYYPDGEAILSDPCSSSSEGIKEETKQTTTKRITSNETITTTTKIIKGCTDINAINYNSSANINDNSCQYKKEITETVTIPYETIIESENKEGKEVIINNGKNGLKEVTYQKIIDSNENEISSQITNEKIIEEPINKIIKYEIINNETNKPSTKKNSSVLLVMFILLILYLINYLYIKKEKNTFSILINIQKLSKPIRIILYILYYLYIIPVIIDFIYILIYLLKKKNIKI